MQYNTAGDARSGLADIFQAIVDVLNAIYGNGTYARATFDGETTGGGRPGLIYRTSSVDLIGQTTASTASSTGGPRQTMRYELRPKGYDASADFYVYVSHTKASNDDLSASRRNVEAQECGQTDAQRCTHYLRGLHLT